MNVSNWVLAHGHVITPLRVLPDASVVIRDQKIEAIIPAGEPLPENVEIVDVKGSYICPGFVDMHVHGGGGADLMDGEVDAVIRMAESHAKGGTTSIVPTTTCSSLDDIFLALKNVQAAKNIKSKGAKILGIHLEGPYLSPLEKGAQDPRYIRIPSREEYLKILDYSADILTMTVAPEIEGALELGKELCRRGIIPSIGHTDATYDQVILAIEAGFKHFTHLYSSMPSVRRINMSRVAGVVEAGYLAKELTVEVIADGKHLPPALLKLVYMIKGPDRTALVTDAMRAAGMPEGESILGGRRDGLRVVVEDGVAKLPDRSAFAGSVSLTSRLVKNMVQLAEIPIKDAVRMASLTPATILGLSDRLGMIAYGRDADLVVLNSDLSVRMTIVEGTVVYQEQ